MKSQVANEVQAYFMDEQTAVGELWWPEEGDRIRCVACGHRCLIGEGKRGVCKVRFNREGQLQVPWGYIAALQCDPVEKKPFFHVYPGSDALTFGMLGCDIHCPYCFLGTTPVPTLRGVETLESLFAQASRVQANADGDIGYVEDVLVFSHSGQARPVRAVFRHPYAGEMLEIAPAFCPPIECTPDHRFLAIRRPRRGAPPGSPTFLPARALSRDWCLAIPKRYFSREVVLDVPAWIASLIAPTRMKRGWSEAFLQDVLSLRSEGQTRQSVAVLAGASRRRVSAVLDLVERGQMTADELVRHQGIVQVESDFVRLFNEHRPGIPRSILLDARLAELLGYYCAEGCVWQDSRRRAHSAMLTFSFGRHEEHLARRVATLLGELFGVRPTLQDRETTCAVVVYKASLGLLFEALCGANARTKRVPPPLFEAGADVAEAFLKAYAAGDGCRRSNGSMDTVTVSRELAYGVACLVLKAGALPFLRGYRVATEADINGRVIHRAGQNYCVRWYWGDEKRRCWADDDFRYIPIRRISSRLFDGYVYNLEVEEDHTYLPGFVAAGNCQNWQTSQSLRDTAANSPMRPTTPGQLVALAHRERAKLLVSSYNEPLITAEWAVAVFKEAKAAGLECAFVSNGNATPEVLDYLRPWVRAYKVDLKSFDDKHYRQLGVPLENVTESIRNIQARGIWLEVVTLVIPGFNDGEEELRQAARFLASVSRDLPWHLTGFHKDYKMTEPDNTEARALVRAAEIGAEAGLRFVYAGNRPGQVGEWENTRCPACRETLIERFGFLVRSYRITPEGRCPNCRAAIPGVWPTDPAAVRTGNLEAYFQVLPRLVR